MIWVREVPGRLGVSIGTAVWFGWLAAAVGCGHDHATGHSMPAPDTALDAATANDAGTTASPTAAGSTGEDAGDAGDTQTSVSGGAGASGSAGNLAADSGSPDASSQRSSTPDAGANAPAPTYPALDFAKIGTPTVIASTYSLAESPLWDHCDKSLLFVDVNKTSMFKLKDGEIRLITSDSGCTNGMAFDLHGDLLLAEMGCTHPGNVSKRDRQGNITVMVSAGPMGEVLHTPDDITQRSDGTIYFSDGDFTYGMHTQADKASTTQLPIYRIRPDGSLVNEGTTTGPNGVELSPDEKTLYVAAYFANQVLKFDVQADGSLKPAGTLVGGAKNADSLCVDAEGNVYIGTAPGLLIVRSNGTQLGIIPIKAFGANKAVTSCDFGGDDGKTLYVTAWTTLSKIERMPIPGQTWTVNRKLPCP